MILSNYPVRPIHPQHVRMQCERRLLHPSFADFLYEEIATRLTEALQYMRYQPHCILDAGCGTGRGVRHLAVETEKRQYIGVDHSVRLLDYAKSEHRPGLLKRWLSSHHTAVRWEHADLAAMPMIEDASIDMIWSNLALHWHPEPHAVIAEWSRVLRPGGLVLFSTFGPSSFQEVRNAARHFTPSSVVEWVDMHDYGDLLLQSGFENPVLDQERLRITYSEPKELLQEMHAMAGNAASNRNSQAFTAGMYRQVLQELEAQRQPDGRIPLTIEVAYAHAWKSIAQPIGEHISYVPLSSIQRVRH